MLNDFILGERNRVLKFPNVTIENFNLDRMKQEILKNEIALNRVCDIFLFFNKVKCLTDIVNNIFKIFNANRKSDHFFCN